MKSIANLVEGEVISPLTHAGVEYAPGETVYLPPLDFVYQEKAGSVKRVAAAQGEGAPVVDQESPAENPSGTQDAPETDDSTGKDYADDTPPAKPAKTPRRYR